MKLKKFSALIFAVIMALSLIPMAALAEEGSADEYAARILQIDSVSGSRIAIAGAKYDILDKDGNVIESVTTDSTGSAQLEKKLTAGEYDVKVVASPAGYAQPTNPIKVTVTAENLSKVKGIMTYSLNVELDAIRGSIVSCDKDGNPIKEAGAIFTLCNQNGSPIETVVTDANGVASFKKNVPYGFYIVKQTKAPKSYYLNREPIQLFVNDNILAKGSNGMMNFELKVKQSNLTAILVVKDAETKELIKNKGMEFHVQTDDGKDVCSLVTEKGGSVAFPDPISYSEYKIFADKLPEGYFVNPEATAFKVTEQDIEVLEDGTYQYTCVYLASPVKTTIKATVNGPVLTSAENEKKNGYDIVKPVFTDEIIKDVELSAIAPEDIKLNYDVKNKAEEVIDTQVTNKNGVAELKEFYIGNYKLVLSKVPTGFVLDNELSVDVEVDDGNQKKDMLTKKTDVLITMKSSEIVLHSVGEFMTSDGTNVTFENKALKGVIYGLYANQDFFAANAKEEDAPVIASGALVDVAESDVDGNVKFEGTYPIGKYVVKQLNVPEHYIENAEFAYEFDLTSVAEKDASEKVMKIEPEKAAENKILKCDASIKSIDADGNALVGAEFAVFNEANEQIASGVTTGHSHSESSSVANSSNGVLGSSGESHSESTAEYIVTLAPGKYTVRQTSPVNGYTTDEEVYSFEITDELNPVEVKTVCAKTVYEIVNLDKDGNPQAGVEFTAYDENGNAVATAVSDENGVVRFEGLNQGKYEIKQTNAPEGYLPANPVEVNIDEKWDNKQEPQKIENKPDMKWIWFVAAGVATVAAAAIVIAVVTSKKKKGSK